MDKIKYVAERLKEKSTWVGIASVAVFFGVPVAHVEIVQAAAMSVAGAVLFFVREGE